MNQNLVPTDKGQKDYVDEPDIKLKPVEIEQIITMAAKKLNLPQEKVDNFIEHAEDWGLTHEHDLYNLTDAKLRAYGMSDRMIETIKKTIEELTIVRKIMHGGSGISKMNQAADDPETMSCRSTTTEDTVIKNVREQVRGNK